MKKIAQRKGLVAWMAVAVVLLYWGGHFIDEGVTHKGAGWWIFGDEAERSGTPVEPSLEKISEKQYKRHCYAYGGLLLIIGGFLMRDMVAKWRERNKLEG